MRALFGVQSGKFLGWWSPDDLVWRDERGTPIGYLEAAYGPWLEDEDTDFDWRAEPQQYELYRFSPDGFGEVGTPHGEVLAGYTLSDGDWAGRFRNSYTGPGRRAVPPAVHLTPRAVPPRPQDRAGLVHDGTLVDPEASGWPG